MNGSQPQLPISVTGQLFENADAQVTSQTDKIHISGDETWAQVFLNSS